MGAGLWALFRSEVDMNLALVSMFECGVTLKICDVESWKSIHQVFWWFLKMAIWPQPYLQFYLYLD